MHVLHVIADLDVGGAELMLSRLVDNNRDPELFHSVVSLTGLGSIGERLRMQGVFVRAMGMKGMGDVPASVLRLRRVIRDLQPDVVQTWMYHADFIGGLAARLAGHRRVMWGIRTTHVQAEGVRTTTWLRKVCAPLSRWIPEKIICAAEASRKAHVAVGYDASRMVVIPNGFDTAPLKEAWTSRAALRAELGFAKDDMVVGAVGRFNPVKDFRNFVEAAALLARDKPRTRFMLVGRNLDHGNSQLVGWIANAGLADRFSLLGERTDIPACYAAMDVFCLSSRSEGFPNVVGEAMAVGVPCVVTDVGDAALLVGEAGIVVPSENPQTLAAGVARLLAMSAHERRTVGLAGQRRVDAEFSIEVAKQKFSREYHTKNATDEETT